VSPESLQGIQQNPALRHTLLDLAMKLACCIQPDTAVGRLRKGPRYSAGVRLKVQHHKSAKGGGHSGRADLGKNEMGAWARKTGPQGGLRARLVLSWGLYWMR